MDLDLTDEQRMIRDTVRQFAVRRVLPRAAEIDEKDEFFWDLLQEAGDLGILGLELPEEWGGAGAYPLSAVLATEEVARCSAVVANTIGAIRLHLQLLFRFGTEAQKREWLPRLSSGREIAALGLSEPEAGSDVAGMRTRAVRTDDGYLLSGTKCFTSFGPICSLLFVLAYTDPEKGTRGGMTLFLVDPKQPGVSIGAPEKKLGQKGVPLSTEFFDDVRLSEADVLGDKGQGFKMMMQCMDGTRIDVAAQSLGLSQACFDAARQYARDRVQFGQRIADFQMIQHMLADMATEIDAGRMLTYRAALIRSKGMRCSKEASMAKLFCSDHAMKHATDALQIFGGYGYTKAYPVERYFRDAKVLQIFDGTSQIQRVIIARHIMREI